MLPLFRDTYEFSPSSSPTVPDSSSLNVFSEIPNSSRSSVSRRNMSVVLEVPILPNVSPSPDNATALQVTQFVSHAGKKLLVSSTHVYAEYMKGVLQDLEVDYLLQEHDGLRCCASTINSENLAVYEKMGRRKYMEDRHRTYTMKIGNQDINFMAVYDGHSGFRAADFVSKMMHQELMLRLIAEPSVIVTDEIISSSLKTTISLIDAAFLDIARPSRWPDGCTSCIVLSTNSHFICANTGDTRAVLSRKGESIDLSIDHKPTRDSEKLRIENSGGQVRQHRVIEECCCFNLNFDRGPMRLFPGGISVTRALGDLHLKDSTMGVIGEGQNCLISHPEICTLERSKHDEFIIIASDGLWDVYSSQLAVDFVRDHIDSHPLGVVAELLIDSAYDLGSGDNVTVVLNRIDNSTL